MNDSFESFCESYTTQLQKKFGVDTVPESLSEEYRRFTAAKAIFGSDGHLEIIRDESGEIRALFAPNMM